MKKITALVALLIVGVAAQANNDKNKTSDTKKIAIVQNSTDKFKVVYLDKNPGKVSIDIADSKGKIVYSQKVENVDGFAQSYDFKGLPEGQYTFNIVNPDGTKTKKAVTFEKPEIQPEFKANILDVNDKNKFRLSVLKSNDEPVVVNIYNSSNKLIHTEKIKESESFRKTYDLGQVKDKDLRFEIKNKGAKVMLSSK